jgi:hypothetical protein
MDNEGGREAQVHEGRRDEVAPSLRWATWKIGKTDRSRPAAGSGNGGQAEADPWAADAPGSYSDEPPF